eukprot:RCo031336
MPQPLAEVVAEVCEQLRSLPGGSGAQAASALGDAFRKACALALGFLSEAPKEPKTGEPVSAMFQGAVDQLLGRLPELGVEELTACSTALMPVCEASAGSFQFLNLSFRAQVKALA